MYDWLSTVNDKFWLILNYSKVIWDIDTKFSPIVVLMGFQLSTKFEGHNSLKKTAMPLGSSKWKWAWRAHFLSHTYETQEICCFLADVKIILLSFFDLSYCLKVAKNAVAFLSKCSELLDLALRTSDAVLITWQLERPMKDFTTATKQNWIFFCNALSTFGLIGPHYSRLHCF